MSNELDPQKSQARERDEILSLDLSLPPRRYEIPVESLPWGDGQEFTYEQAQKLKALGLCR